jgi:hypothetical protein
VAVYFRKNVPGALRGRLILTLEAPGAPPRERTLDVALNFELVSWVRSFGPDVRALEPAALVEQLRTDLTRTARLYERLAGRVHVDVMPTLGTHKPMTDAQLRLMFGDRIPRERVVDHDWRNALETLGDLPAEFLAELSGGRLAWPVPVAVNRRVGALEVRHRQAN